MLFGKTTVCYKMWRVQGFLVVALSVGLTHSWDIVVSAGNRLEFYTSDGNRTNTVHFNSQNLTTITYDEVHNQILYVDKQSGNDAICGYNIASTEYKCYIERNGRNIQGLVFDPVTEKLFFTDTKERSINWYSFKPGFNNNVFGNLLIKLHDGIPNDIAVDSCRGYVYWINRKLTTSTIERARFNGSERHVVINTNELDLHGLTICLQTNKIYWVMPEFGLRNRMYSASLNGNSRAVLTDFASKAGDIQPFVYPNMISVSNKYVYYVDWCLSCRSKRVWKYTKPIRYFIGNNHLVSRIQTESVVGIAANYKMNDQFLGISECNQVPSNYEKHDTKDSFIVAREFEGSFCDHGIKVSGKSFCKCLPGYIGTRCDVSVCENYCLHGDCSIDGQGLPKCSCNARYSGERCEANVCQGHCSNNGICSLNEKSQPVCQCKENYLGDKCEISACHNYCLEGNCSINEEGLPACRCNLGYSGRRCEVNDCLGYCLNNGVCSLNEEDEVVCECVGEYEGQRCDIPVRLNEGEGSLDVGQVCQCNNTQNKV